MENIEKFKQILEEFQNIPKKEQILPTFLEIAGQPHFENVCSNILRYFFDTRESHKFNDLLLKSFLNCVTESYAMGHNLKTLNIYREYSAKKNKRIDLVIECEDIVIVIENKIYHRLDNDLDLYEKSINSDFKNIKQKVFIVLSLKEETINTNESSFVNITYSTFFNNLKSELGHHFVNANNQYTTFLLDFIKTIENLMKNNNINKEFFDFFIKNKIAIDELMNEHSNLEKNRVEEIDKIASILLSKKENINIRRADGNNIFIKIKLDNIDGDLQFQCYFGLTGVIAYLRVDNYKGNVYDLLDDLQLIKENPNLKPMNKSVGYVIYDEPIKLVDIKAEDFADKIINIIDKIKFN